MWCTGLVLARSSREVAVWAGRFVGRLSRLFGACGGRGRAVASNCHWGGRVVWIILRECEVECAGEAVVEASLFKANGGSGAELEIFARRQCARTTAPHRDTPMEPPPSVCCVASALRSLGNRLCVCIAGVKITARRQADNQQPCTAVCGLAHHH
jgi:hypothetical protein